MLSQALLIAFPFVSAGLEGLSPLAIPSCQLAMSCLQKTNARQQPFSVQAAEAKVGSSSETQSNPDLEKLKLALEAANREKDARIAEQAAEIHWLNHAPARIRCLLDARNKRIEELEGINNSPLDENEEMKHGQ